MDSETFNYVKVWEFFSKTLYDNIEWGGGLYSKWMKVALYVNYLKGHEKSKDVTTKYSSSMNFVGKMSFQTIGPHLMSFFGFLWFLLVHLIILLNLLTIFNSGFYFGVTIYVCGTFPSLGMMAITFLTVWYSVYLTALDTIHHVMISPLITIIDMIRGSHGNAGSSDTFYLSLREVLIRHMSPREADDTILTLDNYLAWVHHQICHFTTTRAWELICKFGFDTALIICVYKSLMAGVSILKTVIGYLVGMVWIHIMLTPTYRTYMAITNITILLVMIIIETVYLSLVECFRALKKAILPGMSLSAARDFTIHFRMDMTLTMKVIRNKLLLNLLVFLDEKDALISKYSRKKSPRHFRSMIATTSMVVSNMINSLDPPEFIRNANKKFDLSSLKETVEIMRNLGYPVDVDLALDEPVYQEHEENVKGWKVGQSSIMFGLRQLKIFRKEEFELLKGLVEEFKWSDEYVTYENELKSVSRYFQNKQVKIGNYEAAIDETWFMLSEIFRNSRITPLFGIWKSWEKKYNLGAFATRLERVKVQGGYKVVRRKIKRRAFFSELGSEKAIMKMWKNFVYYFPAMTNISTAFLKSEALPSRKWMKEKVRTPISSMLPQYLFQMVFSYEPNHRYRPDSTPIKVGMPVNGKWMSQLFEKHMKFDKHYAGDMSDFDSNITGPVVNAIKEIRKRGFTFHKSCDVISLMLDINYEAIEESLILMNSTGGVYRKGQGLTTGHASTSMDNSVATVFFYMAAWKELTGGSARDFKNFNELSVYGDDHILSMAANSPSAWNFPNIQKVMEKWGVELRDEMPFEKVFIEGKKREVPRDPRNINPLSFLSKFSRVPLTRDREDIERAMPGHPVPSRIVFHDPEKLMAKAACGAKSRDPFYRVERLIGYLYLTSHQEHNYQLIRDMIEIVFIKNPKSKLMKGKIPSYEKVIRVFYDPNSKPKMGEEVLGEEDERGRIFTYGRMTTMDYVLNYLSLIPDVLNHRVMASGFSNMVQKTIQPFMEWPKELIMKSNGVKSKGHLVSLMSQTPYRFIIDMSLPDINSNTSTLLTRHWIFSALTKKRYAFDPFGIMDKVSQKLANLHYIIQGKITTKFESYSFPYYEIFLTLILNLITIPDLYVGDEGYGFWVDEMVMSVPVIDLPLFLSRITDACYRMMFASLPANFKELSHLTRVLKPGSIHCVQAGTGTGKSTAMVAFLEAQVGSLYHKILVVEPRSKIVTGLTKYMQELGLNCTGMTTGFVTDKRAKVYYLTAQELLLHMDLFDPRNLLIIDESHITEAPYNAIKALVSIRGSNSPACIFSTATPEDWYEEECDSYVSLPIAKPYMTDEVCIPVNDRIPCNNSKGSDGYWRKIYFGIVSAEIASAGVRSKHLIFVPDKADVEFFVSNLKGKGFCLTSESKGDIPDDVDFVVCTAVADVAITIPGVTNVVTPNFTRTVQAEYGNIPLPCYTFLPEMTRIQRRGRTGRTNNGKFTYVLFDFLDGSIRPSFKDNAIIKNVQWAAQGLPMDLLYESTPEALLICGADFTGQEQEFAQSFKDLIDRYETRSAADFRKSVDQPTQGYTSTSIMMKGFSGTSSGYEFKVEDLENKLTQLFYDVVQKFDRSINRRYLVGSDIMNEEVY